MSNQRDPAGRRRGEETRSTTIARARLGLVTGAWVLAFSAALLASAPLAIAQTAAQTDAAIKEDGTLSTGFAGASAGIVNMLYTPLKIVYAASGIVVMGLTWMFSGGDRAGSEMVARSAIRGDYVLTPSHLNGSKSFKFRGD